MNNDNKNAIDAIRACAQNEITDYLTSQYVNGCKDKSGKREVKILKKSFYFPILDTMLENESLVGRLVVGGESIVDSDEFKPVDALIKINYVFEDLMEDNKELEFDYNKALNQYANSFSTDGDIVSLIKSGFNTNNLDYMITNFMEIAQQRGVDKNNLTSYEPSSIQESGTKEIVERHYDVQEVVIGMGSQFELVLHDIKEQHVIELNDYKRANRKNLVTLGVLGLMGLAYLGISNAKLSDEVEGSNKRTWIATTQTLDSVSQTATDLATSSQARINKTTSTAQAVMADSLRLRKKLRENDKRNANDMNDLFDLLGTTNVAR